APGQSGGEGRAGGASDQGRGGGEAPWSRSNPWKRGALSSGANRIQPRRDALAVHSTSVEGSRCPVGRHPVSVESHGRSACKEPWYAPPGSRYASAFSSRPAREEFTSTFSRRRTAAERRRETPPVQKGSHAQTSDLRAAARWRAPRSLAA